MKSLLLIFFLSVFLLACHQGDEEHASSIKKKSGYSYFIGKPHAAISMGFEFLNKPEINQLLDVKLTFKVGRDASILKVDAHAHSSMPLLETDSRFYFNRLVQGEEQAVILRLLPKQTGKQVLHISASIDVNGIEQSRAFVVPVNIGNIQTLKSQQVGLYKGMKFIPEQNVVSMPAIETIY